MVVKLNHVALVMNHFFMNNVIGIFDDYGEEKKRVWRRLFVLCVHGGTVL